MKTCPNPKCKTTGLPDEAKFCPNCGAPLTLAESTKRMTISECRLVPNTLKQGEQCKLYWKGENVEFIEVNSIRYKASDEIVFTPSQSHTCNVSFYGGGSCISKQVHIIVEKTSIIVFYKRELNRISAYDTYLRGMRVRLNGNEIVYTDMKPFCRKDIAVKSGDFIEVIGDYGSGSTREMFVLTITDKILENKIYYLVFVKEFLLAGEMKFYAGSM